MRIPLMVDGQFQVIAYLLRTGQKRTVRPVAVQLGPVEVRLVPGAGPQRVKVNIDAKKVQEAITDLAQREAAKAAQQKGQ